MKKMLTALLMLLGVCVGYAQENDGLVYPGTFYGSFGVGGFAYSHSGEANFGAPAASLTGGVWLASPLAFQLTADEVLGTTAREHSALFNLLSAEFKWDANSTFFHVYNKRFLSPIPFYPIFGLGYAWVLDMDAADTGDHSFHISLGLQAPVRINDHLDAVFNYRCYFLPQGFDNSHGDNYIHTFGVGLQIRQGADPYHRRTERYTRDIGEDWFMQIGVGPNYSAFELFSNPDLGGLSMLGWTPEIGLGRNFSNFWALRVMLGGLTAHEAYDTVQQAPQADYSFSFLHADLMLNVSNLIMRGRGVRFNVIPYLGAGPIWRYDEVTFDIAADAGLMLRYYLNRKSDLYCDLRYVVISPSMGGGTGPANRIYGVGLPSITVGYIYNFGHNTTRYRIPLDKVSR